MVSSEQVGTWGAGHTDLASFGVNWSGNKIASGGEIMALLVECPQCKRRNSQKEKTCKGCGFGLAKHSGRVWWIEYYDHNKRLRRERIGPNKAAAEQKYREIQERHY
jgi:hypothetical protein